MILSRRDMHPAPIANTMWRGEIKLPFAGYSVVRPLSPRLWRGSDWTSECAQRPLVNPTPSAGAGGRMFRRHTLNRAGAYGAAPGCSSPVVFPGGHRSRVTPVPIPNTEVKPATADGTAAAGLWESRSLPGVNLMKRPRVEYDARPFVV